MAAAGLSPIIGSPPVESPSYTRQIAALTGLRAYAAWWVVLYHSQHYIRQFLPWMPIGVIRRGYFGVDVFFALSGFIISWVYASQMESFCFGRYLKFLQKRIARMYPVHALTLLLTLGFLTAVRLKGTATAHSLGNWTAATFFENVLLIYAWIHQDVQIAWNGPSWSISCEWLAYLCFPLIPALRLARKTSAVMALLLFAAVAAHYYFVGIPATSCASDWSLPPAV